jgi:zinc transporter, ZIP family
VTELTGLLIVVFFAALLTAIATGVGAVPFFFVRDVSTKLGGAMEGLAAGMMAAASAYLIYEGLVVVDPMPTLEVIAGVLAGVLFFLLTARWLDENEHFDIAGLRKSGGAAALLIVAAMTAHSFPEGVAVGVAFATTKEDAGLSFGAAITTAIAFHNVPEGLAISVALRSKGIAAWKCVLWAIATSLPQPAVAPFAAWLTWLFAPLLPAGMGFAAGAMLALVAMDLLPGSAKRTGVPGAIGWTTAGIALMTGLSVAIGSL